MIDTIQALLHTDSPSQTLALAKSQLARLPNTSLYILDQNLDILICEQSGTILPHVRGGPAWDALGAGKVCTDTRCWLGHQSGSVGVVIEAETAHPPELSLLPGILVLVLCRIEEAQKRLHTSMLLTTLSQSLPIPMVLATSAGEILMTNPAMEEFTGWSLEDFKTQGWFECLYPDPVDRARAVASVRGTFSGNLAKRAPWRITHKDGSSRNILLSSGTLPSKPDSFILGFFEPVCPYKSQEPGTDRSISFLAHELQNLLMAFQGPAEFFARTQADSPAASCLSAAFSRAQKLVHQLRAFTPSLPPLRPASLVEVVKQTLNSLPARSPRPELYAEPLLPPVDLDPASFQTLLLNLLSNTELAAPGKSPQILLQPASLPEAPLKNYAFPHMQDWVELSIEDDGPGFSEEQLAQVGQLFCSSWPGHSGLGLAAVNRIVQTHHGALHITHAPTRVSIYLPVSPHPPVEDALKLDPSAGGTERIWVLDDDDAVRDYLTSTLSAFGYRVRGFGSATDLVEAAEQEPCDLLISDLVMPGQDGMETFLNLRARGHRFPVLFCSGWPDRSLPTGRDVDFLQKPFPIRTLASRVRSLLNYTVPQ